MKSEYIVYIGWFDDLNFKYVYPEKRIFHNKEDADKCMKEYSKSGFNTKLENHMNVN